MRRSRYGASRVSGLKLSEPIPDESTILHFRHLLEERQLGDGLFKEINAHLESQGLRLRGEPSWTPALLKRRSPSRTGTGSGTRSWALRNSSGISEGIYKSMVQSDREFLRVRVGDRQ